MRSYNRKHFCLIHRRLNFADIYRRNGNYHLQESPNVFESVGSQLQDSFMATCIGGTVVFYSMSGGDPAMVDPRMLMDTSKTLTGCDLWNVLTSRDERVARANELFRWMEEGKVIVSKPTVFALRDGQETYRYLKSCKSTGKILLVP